MTGPRRSGAVAGAHGKQHVDLYRKIQLRRSILRRAGLDTTPLMGPKPLAAFVPYCGDGDLAVELDYAYRFEVIYANDLDPARVATFLERVRPARDQSIVNAIVADADAGWPEAFVDDERPVALADLDAYAYPYDALRSLLAPGGPRLAPTLAVFLTDGQRQPAKRSGIYREPDGTRHGEAGRVQPGERLAERRTAYNFWWARFVKPQVAAMLEAAGYTVTATSQYLRQDMLYAGLIAKRAPGIRVRPARTVGPARDIEATR